ncbi:MAG TPA: VOC family protein [Dehalococcoidia bacterium]|nr:VOC family protein [Dehalococcoidia bacterium]
MKRFDSLDHLSLNVTDVRRAYEFYRDFIGLRAGSYFDDGAEVWAGSAICMLLKGEPSTQGVHFGFREDTRTAVDDWARKAASAGIPIDFGPGLRDWGGYEVTILDPDGYAVQIWTEASE